MSVKCIWYCDFKDGRAICPQIATVSSGMSLPKDWTYGGGERSPYNDGVYCPLHPCGKMKQEPPSPLSLEEKLRVRIQQVHNQQGIIEDQAAIIRSQKDRIKGLEEMIQKAQEALAFDA